MTKPHIDHGFDQELDRLRALTARMAGQTERMLAETLLAARLGDRERAREIVASDKIINALEVQIDERCLKLLARWQPVASDLRYVAATLKLVTDLERIGDHCVNISEWVLQPEGAEPLADNLGQLGSDVQHLLTDALASLDTADVRKAAAVLEGGRQIDQRVHRLVQDCFHSLRNEGLDLRAAVRAHELAGYLQRIGAHATNIAEMVVFLVRGEDVRHAGKLPETSAETLAEIPERGRPR